MEIEQQYSIKSIHGRKLFHAVAEKHGLKPYRYKRQQRQTLVLKAEMEKLDAFWSEFQHASKRMNEELDEVASWFVEEFKGE